MPIQDAKEALIVRAELWHYNDQILVLLLNARLFAYRGNTTYAGD